MVGWKIQKPGDGAHYALLGNKQTNCSHISRFLTKHMILLGCGFINIAVGIIVILDSRCGEATQTIVVWKFMFGLTAIINVDPSSRSALFVFGFVVFPIVLFVVIPLLLNATIACFSPKSSIYNKFLYPFLYLFFWVEEIIAIEQSIKANPELDHQAENRWNFGQVTSFSPPSGELNADYCADHHASSSNAIHRENSCTGSCPAPYCPSAIR